MGAILANLHSTDYAKAQLTLGHGPFMMLIVLINSLAKDLPLVDTPQQKSSSNSSKRRRPSRRRHRSSAKSGPKSEQEASAKSSRSGRRRRRRGGPKLTALDRLILKIENLRHAHLEARRKYFELFDRADPRQRDKLERQFSQSMKVLRDFEDGLSESDRHLFNQHYDAYPEDLTYASNHQLPSQGEAVSFEGEFDDPHELESQKQADYEDDDEESVGTLEDYKAYKGL